MLDHKLNIDTYVYEFERITIYEFTLRHDYQEYKNLPSFLKVKSFSKHSSNLKPNFLTR